MTRLHRGQKVWHLPTVQIGVVEGWKGDEVLVLWGVHDNRVYRDWVRREDVVPT